MFIRICFAFAVAFLLAVNCLGQVQNLDDRLAEFEFEKSESSDVMSVLIERVSITEALVKLEPEMEREPDAPEYQRELGSTRTLQRVVFGSNGKKSRLDGIEYSMIGDGGMTHGIRESLLVHENEAWYFSKFRREPSKGILTYPVKGGVVPILTETRWKNPFEIALSEATALLKDGPSPVSRDSYSIAKEELLENGNKKFTAFKTKGAVIKIVFNKDEDWMVEEIDFLRKNMTQEEEIARKPLIKLTDEMLKDYFSYSTNRTEWKEVEGHWVPWVTRINYKSHRPHEGEDYEIRFRDWKFKGDVDQTLLDESNFTMDKIAASINFNAIRDFFDKPN
jgi:hypothetical protein